jgi:glycerophosphoryl diester phosphodiesterase
MRHIPRGLLIREPKLLKQAPNTALQLGCKQLGIHYPLLNHEVIQYCHRYDLPVSAWTVNDIETIKQLINWQVDVIITDYPRYLLLP